MAQKAAINICIKGAIAPIGRLPLLTFVTLITLVEGAICVTAILKLPLVFYPAIIFVTLCLWFILIVVALALGDVFSETVLAKLMTTVFGKLIERVSQWMS
jgi:hypothetical protein